MSALTAELAIIDISRAQRLRLDACRVIDAVSDLYENDDALARRKAIAAFEQERPAFWTSASYHSQKACALQIAAHEMPLPKALKMAYRGGDYLRALDSLIPLNNQAASVLVKQYAEYGSFVLEEELLQRRYKRMPPTSAWQAGAWQGVAR